jgi:hypothetical protein
MRQLAAFLAILAVWLFTAIEEAQNLALSISHADSIFLTKNFIRINLFVQSSSAYRARHKTIDASGQTLCRAAECSTRRWF